MAGRMEEAKVGRAVVVTAVAATAVGMAVVAMVGAAATVEATRAAWKEVAVQPRWARSSSRSSQTKH